VQDRSTVEQHRCVFESLLGLSPREVVGYCEELSQTPSVSRELQELLLLLARAAGVWDYLQRDLDK